MFIKSIFISFPRNAIVDLGTYLKCFQKTKTWTTQLVVGCLLHTFSKRCAVFNGVNKAGLKI